MRYPFVQARSYTKCTNRAIDLIVVHDMEYPERLDGAEQVAQYFSRATTGSAHYCCDADSTVQCVKDMDIAWHAPGANHDGIGIEHAGYARQTAAEWADPYSEAMLKISAKLCAELCKKYNLPHAYVDAAGLLKGYRGFTTHHQVSLAFKKSCVSADTPILCRDLTWRPAGDLLPGDELVAFDEQSPNQEGRRFRNAVVTANRVERDALLAIHTASGTVRCNYEHPWLTRRSKKQGQWGRWEWVRAADLEPHDVVMRLFDPWTTDRSWEAGWLAGMYDGEGWFSRTQPSVAGCFMGVCQRDSPTADQLEAAIKERVSVYRTRRLNRSGCQPLSQFVISKRSDMMRMLGMVRPPRLLDLAQDFWVGGSLGKTCERVTIESIEPAGTGFIANLATDTATYIAGGFAMHNSHWDPGPNFPMAHYLDLVRAAAAPAPIPQEDRLVVNAPIVALLTHSTWNGGYIQIGADGGTFSHGAAPNYGSAGGSPLNSPVACAAVTPSGQGYWLAAKDGGVFNYGDAAFHGSMGGAALNKPVVAMIPTASGQGYWLTASDGGVFSFGDAAYQGSVEHRG